MNKQFHPANDDSPSGPASQLSLGQQLAQLIDDVEIAAKKVCRTVDSIRNGTFVASRER